MTIEEEIQIGREYCLERGKDEMLYGCISKNLTFINYWSLCNRRGTWLWRNREKTILMIL